jgi:branched-chain amino acid transport system permease protein
MQINSVAKTLGDWAVHRNTLSKTLGLAVLAVLLILAPFSLGLYHLDLLVMLLINVIIVASFRIIVTWGGWSLAHIPLMGLGGYFTAMMTKTLELPFWLTLPLAAIGVAVIALVMSIPLARTKLFAFFLGSFAIGEAMRLSWTRLVVPFGGHRGITMIPPPESIPLPGLRSIDFGDPIPYYFLALVLTTLCLMMMYRLEKSRIFATFKAIGSQDSLAESVGISVVKYKVLAFVVGSFFAGIAGVLFAHHFRTVEPSGFSFAIQMYLLIWVIVGGYRTFVGPILGLVVMTVIHELLRMNIDVQWIPMFYGLAALFVMLFLRGGLETLPGHISPLIQKIPIMNRRRFAASERETGAAD